MSKSLTTIDEKTVLRLYKKYADDLRRVRKYQKQLYKKLGYWHERHLWYRAVRKVLKLGGIRIKIPLSLRPQLDDIEAEITYLLIRETKPDTMVEISPAGGWSTTWILNALKDNKRGRLFSYDLVADATKTMPRELSHGRWKFVQGDITKNLHALPKTIDYLFIDSDHSTAFATWFTKDLFSRLRQGIVVNVHDVFHTTDPDYSGGEGSVVLAWLEKNNTPYFTPSQEKNPLVFHAIMQQKRDAGLAGNIHHWQANSMIFFISSIAAK